MEIPINQENLRFLQSYIRKFINDDQYEESLILNIINNNNQENITYKNDDLILFLQEKKNIDNDYVCNVSLIKEYKYQFNYFNENITVILNISKETQTTNYNNIFDINWNNISEYMYLEGPEKFINDINFVFYLKNPDIEHYCKENKHISESISFSTNNSVHDTILSNFSNNKNIDIKVFQLDNNDFKTINCNIDNYILNIKVDGIRTLIVIADKIIMCYQGDKKFIYNYDGPEIDGSYIFDCELCNGNLHIFDCWWYSINNDDIDVYKYPLLSSDNNNRINVINSFCKKYNFIEYEYISIDYCPIKNISTDYRQYCYYIKDFIEDNNLNDIIEIKRTYYQNEDFSQKYYDNLNTPLDKSIDINNNINYFNKQLSILYSKIPTYKSEAYNLCKLYNIPNDLIYAYSPYIILGLIYYYYLIDFKEDDLIFKKYVYSDYFVKNNQLKLPFTPTITDFYKKSQYPNDGLIFVKNNPIDFTGNKTNYYKWKPKDKLSYDIKIEFEKDEVIDIYNTSEKYVLASFLNSKNKPIETSNIKVKLNNFNKTLPCCKNGDIVLSGDIVEIVPYFNDFTVNNILLRIRYDKVKANGEKTIKTIKKYQSNFTNLIM